MVYTYSLDSVDESSVNKTWSAELLFETHFPGSLERPDYLASADAIIKTSFVTTEVRVLSDLGRVFFFPHQSAE